MDIKILNYEFVVCKLETLDEVNIHDEYCFISKTDEEISLVCTARYAPNKVIDIQKNFKGFRIEGELDFNLVGVIARISTLLSLHEISIFTVSTFNTDYFFVKGTKLTKAMEVLKSNNYNIIHE